MADSRTADVGTEASADVATELDSPVSSSTLTAGSEAFLVVRKGGAPQVVTLPDGAEITIGRAPEAAVFIDDARVSRQHARIVRRGVSAVVTDLGSRNGTRVNGVVVYGEERAIRGGDAIGVGPAEIIVAIASPQTQPLSSRPPSPEGDAFATDDFVIADPAMAKVHEVVKRLARANTTVLLLGETGVGKEVVAERIHRMSPRASGPFVRLNCASIPETLLESELFGHEKAAFTGADRRKIGYLEASHRGTLLLDELGELPLAMQAKLLRVLESRRVARLGGTQEIDLDLRVVCATHRDLEADVAAGRFRQDLYYRIATFVLRVPPLRERRAEIALLAHRFVRAVAERMGEPPKTIGPDAMGALEAYDWPGNLRELRNAMEHAVVLADDEVIQPAHLPASLTQPQSAASAASAPQSTSAMPARLAALEKKSIEDALLAESGNQTRAAERLGISRRALLYKLAKYGIRR
jgi:DNA-binding NtrC family response regulator